MAQKKTAKVLVKRKKFQSVEIPLTNTKIELIGDSIDELKDKTIKLDLTRQLKGKSIEAIVKIKIKDEKAIAYPQKIKLMSYFIKRMIRKRISYVEDSFETPSQENMIIIKPFLITRKKVSRAVRKALRNRCKNWLEDYLAERKNDEIFNDILSNKLQRSLSLVLKKTYPLSLCEIRILELKRELTPKEIPKVKKEIKQEIKPLEEEIIDQVAELEKEKKEKAEKEIRKTQEKAISEEDTSKKPAGVLDKESKKEKTTKDKKEKTLKIKETKDKKEEKKK